MTVRQLKSKLSEYDDDVNVCIENSGLWLDGVYTADKVSDTDGDTIIIGSNYEKRVLQNE